jgi:hypothetical protein
MSFLNFLVCFFEGHKPILRTAVFLYQKNRLGEKICDYIVCKRCGRLMGLAEEK